MRRIVYLLFLLGLAVCGLSSCNSQPGKPVPEGVYADESDVDLGLLPDTTKNIRHRYEIINNSSETRIIRRVIKDCGCTSLSLSDTLLAPHKSVFLDVAVNVAPNVFYLDKSIAIYLDNQKEPMVVYIRAQRKMPDYLIVHDFPEKVSEDVRLNLSYILMGYVCEGEVKSDFINIINTADVPKKFTARLLGAPPTAEVIYDEELAPQVTSRIVISIDRTSPDQLWGLQRYTLQVTSDGSTIELPVEAIFTEKLDKKSSEKPRIVVPVQAYTIDTSEQKTVEFTLNNIGNSTLEIRDINILTHVGEYSIANRSIAPAGQETLTVTVPQGQKEDLEIGITTNDPAEPLKILKILCKHP